MGSSKKHKDKKSRSSKPKDAGASVVSLLVNPHIEGGGAHFDVPKPEANPSSMTKEAWMAAYGTVLQSELHYLARDPDWATDPTSWWYRATGRAGESPPLWMRDEWHMADLDYKDGGDRHTTTVDQRQAENLWTERMNLNGEAQGGPSSTIYGHRQEYQPAAKSVSRSMYDRYQPSYQRIVDEEIPDTAAPPDGRFWAAGVAQGVTTNPYEKRMALSGHRKPIVIGPNSISVVVDGEGHTLANVVADVAWNHPHVVFSGYSLEHPVYRHMNLRLQVDNGEAETCLVESLQTTREVVGGLGSAMDDALREFKT
jgi:DNA-directed RNA polymerase subunit L